MNLWDTIKIINHGYRRRKNKLKAQKTFLINLAKDFPNKAIRWPFRYGIYYISILHQIEPRKEPPHGI